jgi:hypothetical protein
MSLSSWDWLEVLSLLMVLFGALFALIMERKKSPASPDENGLIPVGLFHERELLEAKKKAVEHRWEWVLVAGLGLEIIAASHQISEAGKLKKEAGDAMKLAQSIGTTNAQLVAANLILRTNVLELESKELRTITPQMRDKFVSILNALPKSIKCPVRVFMDGNDAETRTYAHQIRELLNDTGYNWPDGDGIIQVSNNPFYYSIDDQSTDCQITFIFKGEHKGVTITPKSPGGHDVWVYHNTDVSGAAGMIDTAFCEIGIRPSDASPETCDFLKDGEWGVWIPQKF